MYPSRKLTMGNVICLKRKAFPLPFHTLPQGTEVNVISIAAGLPKRKVRQVWGRRTKAPFKLTALCTVSLIKYLILSTKNTLKLTNPTKITTDPFPTPVSSKVMYTEFKVYQLNFKPSCPSNPHPVNDKRKYILASQLYYIAALSLMRKSYQLNEWPKDSNPWSGSSSAAHLPPSAPLGATGSWAKAAPALHTGAAWGAQAEGMGAAHLGLGQDLWLRKQTKASDSKASRLILLSCAPRLETVSQNPENYGGECVISENRRDLARQVSSFQKTLGVF